MVMGVVTLGSEACLVDGVMVENCKVEDPPDVGKAAVQTCLVKLKVRPDTPQHYQNIHFRNIALNTIGSVVSIEPWTQFFNLKGQAEPAQCIENITVENVSGKASEFGRIAGPPKCTIRNISLRNLDLTLKKAEVPIEKVEGLTIQNFRINGKAFSHSEGVR